MNFGIYAIGLLGFWICGFAIMAGGWGAVVAFDGPNILDKLFCVHDRRQALRVCSATRASSSPAT